MMVKRKRSNLALLAAGAGGAAVAGFGLALGKDVYKKSKKNLGLILVLLVVLFFPFFGGRELVRGHDRGLFGTIFVTILGSLLLISAGFLVAALLLTLLPSIVEIPPQDAWPLAAQMSAILTAFVATIGLLVGLLQRPRRLKAIATARFNEQFLKENGFRETDGSDITHYDGAGQPLRLLEAHPERLVFMAVGRRGKRAFIDLDANGRMLQYSGIG